MSNIRVPILGTPTNRDALFKDQRFINGFPEAIVTEENGQRKYFFAKRSGHTISQAFAAASGAPQGVFYWNFHEWAAYGGILYYDNKPLITLTTTIGQVGFTAIGSDQNQLFVCDGTAGWIINKDNTYQAVIPTTWAASIAYTVGQRVNPSTYNGYTYECVTSGTSAGSAPSFPTTIGNTVTDGSVIWQCIAYVAFPTPQPTVTWSASKVIALGTILLVSTLPSLAFIATVAGTTGSSQPTWGATVNETVVDGTVTWTAVNANTLIIGHIPHPIYLDGYVFLINSSGNVVNSDILEAKDWPALDYTSPQVVPDAAVWMDRQVNQIAVFGSSSIQFFYNAGTASGSPLSQTEQATILVGTASGRTVQEHDGLIIFVARSGTGGVHVAAIQYMLIRPISDAPFNRILEAEGDTINQAWAYTVRSKGHYFYVLNLVKQQRTLVYDIDQKFWHEWTYNGSIMPFMYSTEQNSEYILQSNLDNNIYFMDETNFTDNGLPITFQVQLTKIDGNTNYRKSVSLISLIGDQQPTSCPVLIEWSDDDYQTWQGQRTVDMMNVRAYTTRAGVFRRRAFRVTHTATTDIRLEGLELEIAEGGT